MSLPGLALLIAMTMALRAATTGWARVLMAPLDALAQATETDRVTIAVTIGDDTLVPEGRKILDGARTVELIVQAILPERVAVSSPAGSATLDTRGSGGKVALAAVHRAIETVLQVDGGGPWHAILASLVLGFADAVEIRPFLIETEKSARLAAAEFAIPCHVTETPIPGESASGVWADLLVAIRADPELAAAADLIEGLIEGTPLPEWRRLAAALGNPDRITVPLGLGALFDETDVFPAEALTLVSNGRAATVAS